MKWTDEVLARHAGQMLAERHVVCGRCLGRGSIVSESNLAARRHFLIVGWVMTSASGWVCPDCETARRAKPGMKQAPDLVHHRSHEPREDRVPPAYYRDTISEARKAIKESRAPRRINELV